MGVPATLVLDAASARRVLAVGRVIGVCAGSPEAALQNDGWLVNDW
jgi:hypothetical protein